MFTIDNSDHPGSGKRLCVKPIRSPAPLPSGVADTAATIHRQNPSNPDRTRSRANAPSKGALTAAKTGGINEAIATATTDAVPTDNPVAEGSMSVMPAFLAVAIASSIIWRFCGSPQRRSWNDSNTNRPRRLRGQGALRCRPRPTCLPETPPHPLTAAMPGAFLCEPTRPSSGGDYKSCALC